MTGFCCPICGEELELEEKGLGCKKNHRFDLSKEGYVNLFLSQQSKQKRHGDDKAMVRARKDFLEKGYYRPLLDGICETVIVGDAVQARQAIQASREGFNAGYYA